MALYLATAKLTDDSIVEFQFWSKGNNNSAKNIVDACDTFMANHNDYSGKIQILKTKRIPYSQLNREEFGGKKKIFISGSDSTGGEMFPQPEIHFLD